MKFEKLRFEHLKQMAQIEREAFSTPWTETMFIPEIEDENAHYLVGTRQDEVVCYGGYHLIFDEAHITNIAVKSTERGKGLGKFLLSALIEDAKKAGANSMTLEVKHSNEVAIKMYESFGFTVEGIRKRYYNNVDDAYVMWCRF